MSGIEQAERQAIVDALDECCNQGVAGGLRMANLMRQILGGQFAPKPEPPAGYRVAGIDMATGKDRTVTSQPATQPDHLAEACLRVDGNPFGSAYAHALIDIAQTLRLVKAHLSRVGSEMEFARTRGGRP